MAKSEFWIVYDHPIDMPTWFVARKETIGASWPEVPYQIILSRDLEALRLAFHRQGLWDFPRFKDDDPVIVETWM